MGIHQIKPVAYIHNGYNSKFGIPRQSGLVDEVISEIVFEPEFADPEALRGIEQYSHLWLIWHFSAATQKKFSPTVRPPRLGGNKRVGVFATRSPFRPNSLGLSSVQLLEVKKTQSGCVLVVSGADLMNGTPIFDIKPYVKYSDCHPDAECGFSDEYKDYSLDVIIPNELRRSLSNDESVALTGILKGDPRPSYQNDPERIYSFEYGDLAVSFRVKDDALTVTDIRRV